MKTRQTTKIILVAALALILNLASCSTVPQGYIDGSNMISETRRGYNVDGINVFSNKKDRGVALNVSKILEEMHTTAPFIISPIKDYNLRIAILPDIGDWGGRMSSRMLTIEISARNVNPRSTIAHEVIHYLQYLHPANGEIWRLPPGEQMIAAIFNEIEANVKALTHNDTDYFRDIAKRDTLLIDTSRNFWHYDDYVRYYWENWAISRYRLTLKEIVFQLATVGDPEIADYSPEALETALEEITMRTEWSIERVRNDNSLRRR